jgi:hypothetical protein
MRWDAMFADLEAQAEAMSRAERAAEVDERARIEVGALVMLDRLRAAVGTRLRLRCVGPLAINGVLTAVGRDWLLLDAGDGREAVVALESLLGVGELGRLSTVPGAAGIVESRLALPHALRGIARDRSPVRLSLADGSTLTATIDRVGADFVDAAIHPAGGTRRRGEVQEIRLVPLAALVAVRREV